MGTKTRQPTSPAPQRVSDRRSFTVAEILRMQDAGVIAEDENFELIEGAIAEAAEDACP